MTNPTPAADKATDERALFEKTMNAARFFPAELSFARTKSPSGRDEYVNSHLQSCWVGWQARAALAGAPVQSQPVPLIWFDGMPPILTGKLDNGARGMLIHGASAPHGDFDTPLYLVAQPAPVSGATSDDAFTSNVLADLARHGASPAGLSLAAQLFGVAPCEACGYRKLYCRCAAPAGEVVARSDLAKLADKWAIYYDNLGEQTYDSRFMSDWYLYDSQVEAETQISHFTFAKHYSARKVEIFAAAPPQAPDTPTGETK